MKKSAWFLIAASSIILGIVTTSISYVSVRSFYQVDPQNGAVCETFTNDCGYCFEQNTSTDGIYSRGWPHKINTHYKRCGLNYKIPISWRPLLKDEAFYTLIFALLQVGYMGMKSYENSRH
jgi:hypothetical protein